MSINRRTGLAIVTGLLITTASFAKTSLHLPTRDGEHILVSLMDNFSHTEQQRIRTWLSTNIEAVSTLYDRYPYPDAVIEVHKRSWWESWGDGPVPWGMVARDNPTRIEFHVASGHKLKDFLDDWTAVHEMSHLFIPNPGGEHSWMGEGLASYMQNILRGRAGMLNQQQVWNKIYAGIRRGEREHEGDPISMAQASQREWGSAKRTIMRIHWGGVTYYLNADIKLRQASGGKQSLATVLNRLRDCCLADNQRMRGDQLARLLDRLSNTTIFTDQYKQYTRQTRFPDYQWAFEQIGVETRGERVALGGSAGQVALRESISGLDRVN